MSVEKQRLLEDVRREKNWKRWGPYLSERQWGTVREDYSPDGSCWAYFPHDHARSRAYRWGEDGIMGLTDRQCRLCFSVALWNERDPILKERLYGLTGEEGNHGEDVKECYYYLDSSPTHSYLKGLYKYPQSEFPYSMLQQENRRRGRAIKEFELVDTGVFNDNRFFDVFVEYAKQTPDDILIKITAVNQGPEAAPLHIIPQLWFRNTWSWGRTGEGYTVRPNMERITDRQIQTHHPTLQSFYYSAHPGSDAILAPLEPAMLTHNESNPVRLFNLPTTDKLFKDGFHEYVIGGNRDAVAHEGPATKAGFHYRAVIGPKERAVIYLRLSAQTEFGAADPFAAGFEQILEQREHESTEYYAAILPPKATPDEARVIRQAYAGLLWSKQFYYYSVREWKEGDPSQPKPAPSRAQVRNRDWNHLYNRDVISMPDKWEYPWYAAWDLAFHMIPFSKIDPIFAKQQLVLFLREWYMHPNGQIPAYEFAFNDVNPPVHAWACWRVYKISAPQAERDRHFLTRTFLKLLLNFNWWINRKDIEGNNLFAGGFLGLDNIGVFDRSQPLPIGSQLLQADGTAWMAFYCLTMLAMSLDLATQDRSYGDISSKFFEHFIAITDAMNTFGGTGLWDEEDGFYYDQIQIDGKQVPLKVRSLVGIIPMLAVEVLEDRLIDQSKGFKKRLAWFLRERGDLARHISYMTSSDGGMSGRRLLAVPTRERLERMLKYILDEKEFLSPFGIRSLSRVHKDHPYVFHAGNREFRVDYVPGESTTVMFGGNSNWRGPVWYPLNYLLIEALEKYHHFYQDSLKVECPTGSGNFMNLRDVSRELARRLAKPFLADESGRRPCHGNDPLYSTSDSWKDLILFYEYFHGDNGEGCGANHQTGWTALVTRCIERYAYEKQG